MVEIKEAKLFQGLPDSEMRSVEKQLKTVNHPAEHMTMRKILTLGGTLTRAQATDPAFKLASALPVATPAPKPAPPPIAEPSKDG